MPMGYMGFGMRKIDYTRKPKKAFKKLKEIYGKDVDLPKSSIKPKVGKNTYWQRHAYVPFDETMGYKRFKFFLFIAVIGSVIWFALLRGYYIKFQRDRFEEDGFVELYNSDLQNLKHVLQFIGNRSDRMILINYSKRKRSYNLSVKYHAMADTVQRWNLNYVSLNGLPSSVNLGREVEITDNHLMVKQNGYLSEDYQTNWIYALRNVKPDQIPSTVIRYLGTNELELEELLEKLKSCKNEVYVSDGLAASRLDHKDFGRYTIVYSSSKLKSVSKVEGSYRYTDVTGKLDQNIYWIREEKTRIGRS